MTRTILAVLVVAMAGPCPPQPTKPFAGPIYVDIVRGSGSPDVLAGYTRRVVSGLRDQGMNVLSSEQPSTMKLTTFVEQATPTACHIEGLIQNGPPPPPPLTREVRANSPFGVDECFKQYALEVAKRTRQP